VEDLDGALGVVDVEHFHEGVALGAVGVAVVNDLDVANAADALEEVGEVAFADVIGEVSNIEARGFDGATLEFSAWGVAAGDADVGLDGTLASGLTGFTWFTRLAGVTWAAFAAFRAFATVRALGALGAWWTDGFLVEADRLEELLPEGQLDRLGLAAFARATLLVVSTLAVLALMALAFWTAVGVLALAVTVLATAVAAAAFLSRIAGI
jgi:hypothetical protein